VSRVAFSKWHGAGNDYVFVEPATLDESVATTLRERAPEIATRISARRTGIGSDGLVLLERDPACDARLVMFNSDGSRGRLCGTALRCAAEGLRRGRFFGAERRDVRSLVLASDAGLHDVRFERGVEVALGKPRFAADAIPLQIDAVRVFDAGGDGPWQIGLEAGGEAWEGLALSMGNPHLVLPLVHDPGELDVERLGPPLERHAAFPERVNASFVHLCDDGTLRQRTFERGSGETLSCGSGAAAAVVALTHLLGLSRDRAMRVAMPGGELGVRYTSEGMVWLSGPVECAFEGSFEP
jgi:diaminopimelate epimerase